MFKRRGTLVPNKKGKGSYNRNSQSKIPTDLEPFWIEEAYMCKIICPFCEREYSDFGVSGCEEWNYCPGCGVRLFFEDEFQD